MSEERCVCCGDIVPEGFQVCRRCEAKAQMTGGFYEATAKMDDGTQKEKRGIFADMVRWIECLKEGHEVRECSIRQVKMK